MIQARWILLSLIFSPISFAEKGKQENHANYHIENVVIPYVEDLLDAEALANLQDFISKDGCAERYIAKHQQAFDEGKPIKCKKSKSPIFSNKDDFDMLKITVISDFNKLNQYDAYKYGNQVHHKLPGVAKIEDNGKIEFVPLELSARGNSRGSYCPWKPQRWSFYNHETANSIQAKVSEQDKDEDDSLFLQRYRQAIINEELSDINKNGKKDKGSIFGKIGDDIKLVTHCGAPKDDEDWLGGRTDEAQKERVLSEFVVYQMLDEMKSTMIKTRLAEITYLSPDGKTLKTSYGFFREPRGAMAKRCGLKNIANPYGHPGEPNPTSDFQLDLFNKFVYSRDYGKGGHNVHIVQNEAGEKVFAPYDYDLSQIIYKGAEEDEQKRIEIGINFLNSFLRNNLGKPIGIVQVYALKRKIGKMKSIVTESPLKEKTKGEFLRWIDAAEKELTSYLTETRLNHPELLESLITKDIVGKKEKKKEK